MYDFTFNFNFQIDVIGVSRTNTFTTELQNVLKDKGVEKTGNNPSKILGDYTDTTELNLL